MSIVVDALRAEYTRVFIRMRGAAKLVAYHHQKASDEEARLHETVAQLAELELAIHLGGGELPTMPVDEPAAKEPGP